MSQLQALVVGANGQVGAAILALLGTRGLGAGRTVSPQTPVALDLIACAQQGSLAHNLVSSHALDSVYCVGGATDVERCESDISWARDTNCYGPAALAAAARHLPFVYFSTDYVFDGLQGPYSEKDVPLALSVYGRSKLEGEQRVLDAHPGALVIRTTGVFGPDRQRKKLSLHPAEAAVRWTADEGPGRSDLDAHLQSRSCAGNGGPHGEG